MYLLVHTLATTSYILVLAHNSESVYYCGGVYLLVYVIVPEKRDLNEANMKIEIYPFSFSSQ